MNKVRNSRIERVQYGYAPMYLLFQKRIFLFTFILLSRTLNEYDFLV